MNSGDTETIYVQLTKRRGKADTYQNTRMMPLTERYKIFRKSLITFILSIYLQHIRILL